MIKFQNEAEANAWARFFAAQCPKIANAAAKNVEKEIESAEASADLMLHSWRDRVPSYEESAPEEEPAQEPANAG